MIALPNQPTSDWVMTAGADDSGDCNWDCDGDYTEDDGTCHETTVVCNIESGGTKIGTGTKPIRRFQTITPPVEVPRIVKVVMC